MLIRKLNFKSKIILYICIIVLLLVAASGAINYLNARRFVVADAISQSTDTIMQLSNSNDLLLYYIKHSLIALTGSVDIEMFAKRYHSLDFSERKVIYDELTNVLTINPFFVACYVYYPEESTIIDVNSYFPRYELIDENSNGDKIAKVYHDFVNDITPGHGIPLYPYDTSADWMMVLPVSYSSYSSNQPVLIITIDSNHFFINRDVLIFPEASEVYIADPRGVWLGAKEPPFSFAFSDQTATSYTLDVESTTYLVSYVYSSDSLWHYIYTIPLGKIYDRVSFFGLVAIVNASFCLIAGFILALIFSGRIYVPIKNLSGKFNGFISAKDGDAIQTIESGVNALVEENKGLQQKIAEGESVMKNTFLKELLVNGIAPYESVYVGFESFGIDVSEQSDYMVAVISLEDTATVDTYSQPLLIMFGIQFEEDLRARIFAGWDILVDSIHIDQINIAVILCVESGMDTKPIYNVISDVRNKVCAMTKIPITLGLSLTLSLEALPELYHQACSAVGYRFVLGVDRVISFAELPVSHADTYQYPWHLENQLLKSLRQEEPQEIGNVLNAFDEYVSQNNSDVNRCRYSFFHFLSNTMKEIETWIPGNFHEIDQDRVYGKLLEGRSTSEIVETLNDMYCCIQGIISRKKNERTDEIALAAMKILEENLSSADLNLDVLADKLGFTGSYISKMFKLSMGMPIKEYITQKRIDKACAMLVENNKKIKEIGEEVGYSQQRSFIEIFKKYKGVTPSEYRASAKGMKS